ncbi:MAG: hypothetical protein AB8I08_08735 [Sandaracinaceae bacterium]
MTARPNQDRRSARAAVVGGVALAMATGLACLVPISLMGGHAVAGSVPFLLTSWLSTSLLVGVLVRLALCIRGSLIGVKSFLISALLGALNGAVVVTLMLLERGSTRLVRHALIPSGLVGAGLGLVVGALLLLPLLRLREVRRRQTRTPSSMVFVVVSGGVAALCLPLVTTGEPGFVMGVAATFVFLVSACARWVWLRRLARGDRPGFECVLASEVDVPDDLLPLHAGVSESPSHVLMRVSSAPSGPFRDAPLRAPYAWVDG